MQVVIEEDAGVGIGIEEELVSRLRLGAFVRISGFFIHGYLLPSLLIIDRLKPKVQMILRPLDAGAYRAYGSNRIILIMSFSRPAELREYKNGDHR
jgi:hypothetical protein